MIAAPLLVFAVAWARPPTAALLATLVFPCVSLRFFRLVQLLQKPAKAEYQQYLHSRKMVRFVYANIVIFCELSKYFDAFLWREILNFRLFKAH